MAADLEALVALMPFAAAGEVRAVAVGLHRGRTAVTVQTTLRDETDRLEAQTTQIRVIRMADQA
ncbi:MAG: hypothetical protein WBH47_16700 [Streptosporangiaceae bacterium]